MKKLLNIRVDEELLEKFKKICEKKGVKMTEVCNDCIKRYVKNNEHILINTDKEEEYTILTNLFDNDYKKYKVVLTKEDLKEIYKITKEEEIETFGNFDFKANFEENKKKYIVNKLIKQKLGKNFGVNRVIGTEGVFELIEDGNIYNKFNAFIFNKDNKLIEGNYFDIGHILLKMKGENK